MATSVEPHVFVSYSTSDRGVAERVRDALASAGVRIWMDRSEHSSGAEIALAILDCQAILLVCTAASLTSANIKQEVMLGWKYQRPYVPLLIEETLFPPELEYWLEGVQWIEVLERPEVQWVPEVLRALERLTMPANEELTPVGSRNGSIVKLPHPLERFS